MVRVAFFTALIWMSIGLYDVYSSFTSTEILDAVAVAEFGVDFWLFAGIEFVLLWFWLLVIAAAAGSFLSSKSRQELDRKTWLLLYILCQIICVLVVYLIFPQATAWNLPVILFESFERVLPLIGCALLLMLVRARDLLGRGLRVLSAVFALTLFFPLGNFVTEPRSSSSYDDPNIIFLGVDSLRYDSVNSIKDPRVRAILAESQCYQDAYTPIARTHGSLTTLLSGQQPSEHGVRFNLQPTSIDTREFLPHQLAERGYHSIFAMDERRFSSIGVEYGFRDIVGPPVGIAEIVVPKLFSNPMSRFVSLLPHAEYIQSYRVFNRANSTEYEPVRFTQELNSRLISERGAPLFLHAHLTLPHYPMTWRSAVSSTQGKAVMYRDAIERVGEQMGKIIETLELTGRLSNSVVVFYSDHGESFNATRVSIGASDNLNIDRSYGHGTNVLSEAQYRIPLCIQRFSEGIPILLSEQITGVRSLGQVKAFTEYLSSSASAGDRLPELEYLVVESGRVTPALLADEIDETNVAVENMSSFVLHDGILSFNEAVFEKQLESKKFAVVGLEQTISPGLTDDCWQVLRRESGEFNECEKYDSLDQPSQKLIEALLREVM